MNSICFFASYFTGGELPYYVTIYLDELRKQFKQVVFLTTRSDFNGFDTRFLNNAGIKVLTVPNRGFDFGKWHQAFREYDVSDFDSIALVNDSCVLFKSLNEFMSWQRTDTADVQGMTKSEAVSPHLQSYFMVLNKKAVALAAAYFEKHGIYDSISQVIEQYEIGMSRYFISNGLSISAFIDNNGYTGEFSPYYQCVDYHLEKGIPLIKKKILFASYRPEELITLARMNFNISVGYYEKKLKEVTKNKTLLDLEKLLRENKPQLGWLERLKYNLTRLGIKLARPFYKAIKGA